MAVVGDSAVFIPIHHLPRQPLWVSGSQAYETLAAAGIGGIVALDGGHPRWFLSSEFIKTGIEFAAEQIGGDAAVLVSLSRHLVVFFERDSRLRQAVKERVGDHKFDFAVMALDESPLPHNRELPEIKPLGIWSVLDEGGIASGWYATGDAFRGFIRTKPDIWKCTNKPSHSNDGPDHNKCRTCGKPLMP